MAAFFRGVREARDRDNLIKQSLTNNLSECVKAIQFNHQTEQCTHQTIGSNDLSNGLCMAIEAIFLHGIKNTFFKKAKSAFSNDVDHRPEPSFWPLLLILSHKDNIEQISSLQQISNDIGQCRAWVRIALNDSLLSSYLYSIMGNINASKPYYSQSAFIRDEELLDLAHRLLEGMESCTSFKLPTNSSLLNSWPDDVLMLTGIWTPTMRSCPVAPGVDVASTLIEKEPEVETNYIPGRGPDTGIGQILELNADEALNFILSNTPENFMDNMKEVNPILINENTNDINKNDDDDNEQNSETIDNEIIEEFDESAVKQDVNIVGNSIIGKTAWSSHFNEDFKLSATDSSGSSLKSHDSKSLSSLVEIGATSCEPVTTTPCIREVIKGLHKELKLNSDYQDNKQTAPTVATPITPDDPLLAGLGFEVVSKSQVFFDSQELQAMTSRIEKLSREYGLDSQDYQCISCHDTLGTTVSKAKVCAFSGQYFCSSCMDPNVFIIPARVIHNWDFHRYPVSKRAANFLIEFQHQPLINIKKINPLIYNGISEMAQLHLLRTQLNFLRAYLFTCREPIIEEFQKRVWPREYLYEHVNVYSIGDLAQIANGSLASQLQKIVTFAQNHVKDCWLCSQKGFICEVCNDPKILYPFDVENTYRCDVCFSVFHSKCLATYKPCPKCERKKRRHGNTLVDAVHNNFQ